MLEVPEDRADPDGRRIELAWAVIPARNPEAAPDPLAFLAGGPGQSARDIAPVMHAALSEVNLDRDLVFLDQRGTGGSNALDCDFGGEEFLGDYEPEEAVDALRDCLESLDADVVHYTTADGADDLEALREHIGVEQWNLYGGSYGTRMGQVYLRRYPGRVRTIVLDGVVPMRLALGSEHAEMLDRAIEKLLAACAADSACDERFPGVVEAFDALKQRYAETTQPIEVAHPRTGEPQPIDFTAMTLAGSLRFLAYAPESQVMIPLLVHEAATTERPQRLASQALIVSDQMTASLAIALNFAVGCSEDWPVWPRDRDDAGTLLGDSMAELYDSVCTWWPTEPVGEDFHAPVESEVPALLLSGEFDPVTPPAYGEEVAAQFPNSSHLVAEGRGHIVGTTPCLSGVIAEFVESADAADLDVECMARLGPEPFFLDLLGPNP
ncbi:MAG: alpha/beta hydrolase [Wenzhouxiangellaceae bacterium]|nr:alpha/beta hydrolase [Wenzhouxiangellaceae bacterium]